jgi:thiosulfate/3-mercaptopyruvate sulfurtransferase
MGVDILASSLDKPDWCVIDCRFDLMNPSAGYESYLEGHIPGAVYANLDEDLAGPIHRDSGRHPLPDIEKFSARCSEFGIRENTEVVVYDSGNNAIAARAWWLLRWLGHNRVTLLDGGLNLWQRYGFPLEKGPVTKTTGLFSARPRPNATIATDELENSVETISKMRLVDARAAARFCGQAEPIDTVAGHIPGALNLPFTDCLNDDGTWRTSEELRSLLAQMLGDEPQVSWGVMCGSGVTACHLAVSGLLAGYREPRLYVGSWSEWIRDRQRPVVTDPA